MQSKTIKAFIITATAAAIIVAAVAVLLYRTKSPALVLKNPDTGRIYSTIEFQDELEFSVSFIHSVNKSRVEEYYSFIDDKLILTGCVYYGFGAGVLTEVEPGWTLSTGDDGEMIVANMNVPMYELSYIVGTVSDHILCVNDSYYSLTDLCGRNSKVAFGIRH